MSTMPPGPKRTYPGSLLLQFRRDPLGQLQKIAREYTSEQPIRHDLHCFDFRELQSGESRY